MNPVTKESVLGFYDEYGIETIFTKQEDTERIVKFSLVDELSDYVLDDTNYIIFRERFSNDFILPPVILDKTEVLSEDGTVLTLKLTRDMLAVSGIAHCDLCFIICENEPEFDEEGKLITYDAQVLTTQTFKLFISPSVYEGDDHNSLTQDYIDLIMPIVIKLDNIVKHDQEYTANEEIRKANEIERQAAESNRDSAEQQRGENESHRQEAEANRISAEDSRVTAETARSEAESFRANAESQRVSSENARIAAETSRTNAEELRTSQEANRVSAETNRNEAETIRASAETERVNAEQTRATAETTRSEAEASRATQETARQTAEETRTTAETTRKSNEDDRQDAESERERAEQERKAKEGAGDYTSPQNIAYTDKDGHTVTVSYQDSRVGLTERLLAIADGGSFIDSSGEARTMVNEYTDLEGHTVQVTDEEFNGMSSLATIVYARYLSGEAADGVEAAVQAASDAEANATLSEQYANEAKEARDSTLDASEQARQAKASAEAAKASADEAADLLDEMKDVIDDLDNKFVFSIDNQGHLVWNTQ